MPIYCIHLYVIFSLATPPTVEEILDKMNYDLVMCLTVEAPVSTMYTVQMNQYLGFVLFPQHCLAPYLFY